MIKDRQVLVVMLGTEVNLKELFRYSVTSVPLSLAFSDLILRQIPKYHFRNHLIDVSKSCESTSPNEARWIIDTMSVMRAIKVKEPYKESLKKYKIHSGE